MPTVSLLSLAALALAPVQQTVHLVACAPGYPGNTTQAQPTMDRLAELLAAAAGLPSEAMTAEYQESEAGGVARLRDPGTQLALVPLPFFLEHEHELNLRPLAQVLDSAGRSTERWSLVAARGRIETPAGLGGWTIVGTPAYSSGFVRGDLLGGWGEIPPQAELTFSGRILAALRRAIAGENVAVLLDGAQTGAFAALPGGGALEIVAASPEVLLGLVVEVDGRLDAGQLERLAHGLLAVHEDSAFAEVLSTVRVSRFEPVDETRLAASRARFAAAQ